MWRIHPDELGGVRVSGVGVEHGSLYGPSLRRRTRKEELLSGLHGRTTAVWVYMPMDEGELLVVKPQATSYRSDSQ